MNGESKVGEVEDLSDAEVDSGSIADTSDLWAEIYERILCSVQGKMNA